MSPSRSFHPEIIESCRKGVTFRATSSVRPDFWRAMAHGNWERDTLRVFDDFVDENTLFYDIGAWMGPTTLYAAPAAGGVVSFEPDPVAFQELTRNVGLNSAEAWADEITLYNQAVGRSAGTMRIGSREGFGQSVSSALYHDAADSTEVEVVSIDSLADDPRLRHKRAFVKIDIEGGEYDLLQDRVRLLEREDSILYLSMHPRILRRRERADSRQTPMAMVRRRRAFLRRHHEVFASLPFRYYYSADGTPLNLRQQFAQALLLGKFQREIVCTHQPWKGPARLELQPSQRSRRSGSPIRRRAA